jgi:hypothetical protein
MHKANFDFWHYIIKRKNNAVHALFKYSDRTILNLTYLEKS